MHESIKIKPCPFCSYSEDLILDMHDKKVFIMCGYCGCRGPEFEFENVFDDNFSHKDATQFAIERWNYRPEIKTSGKLIPESGDTDIEINTAVEKYMTEKLNIDHQIHIKKFLIACDMLSFLKKPFTEE